MACSCRLAARDWPTSGRRRTPSLLQRLKRTNTEFQLPYRSGRSRHGAPVRKTQSLLTHPIRLLTPSVAKLSDPIRVVTIFQIHIEFCVMACKVAQP